MGMLLVAAGTRGGINSFTPGMPLEATVPFCKQHSARPKSSWQGTSPWSFSSGPGEFCTSTHTPLRPPPGLHSVLLTATRTSLQPAAVAAQFIFVYR